MQYWGKDIGERLLLQGSGAAHGPKRFCLQGTCVSRMQNRFRPCSSVSSAGSQSSVDTSHSSSNERRHVLLQGSSFGSSFVNKQRVRLCSVYFPSITALDGTRPDRSITVSKNAEFFEKVYCSFDFWLITNEQANELQQTSLYEPKTFLSKGSSTLGSSRVCQTSVSRVPPQTTTWSPH